MPEKEDFFVKWTYRGAFLLLAALFLVVFFRLLAGILLPFLIAYLAAQAVRRPARVVARRTRLPEKGTRVVLMLFFLVAMGLIVFLLCQRLMLEAGELLSYLARPEVIERSITAAVEFFSRVSARFPRITGESGAAVSAFLDNIGQLALEGLGGAISALSAGLPALLSRVVTALPDALFSVVLTLLSAFYFCLEPKIIGRALEKLLPRKTLLRLHALRRALRGSAVRYLRGYGLLLLITFAELFFAFAVLRIRYSFLLALLIALADLLPVIGVGTVLLPWSAVLLLRGEWRLAVALLVVLGVETVLRQLLEPKIIGHSVGLHPLVMLLSVYAGSRLLGMVGLLAGPAAAIVIRAAWPVFFPPGEKGGSDRTTRAAPEK